MTESEIDFTGESDPDLLQWMAVTDEPIAAKAAFAEFYRRHSEFVHGTVERQLSTADAFAVNDVVQDVFLRTLRSAKTFTMGAAKQKSDPRQAVRAWLGRIVYTASMDSLNEAAELTSMDPAELDIEKDRRSATQSDRCLEDTPQNRAKIEALKGALEELSERESSALTACAPFWADESFDIPEHVSKAICNELRTTPEGLRQMRCRALKHLRSKLKDEGISSAAQIGGQRV